MATDKIEDYRGKLTDLRRTESKPRDARIFPRNFAPIIVMEGGQHYIRLGRYLLRRRGMPPSLDNQFSGAYNSRRDNLFKFWRPEVGKTQLTVVGVRFDFIDSQEDALKRTNQWLGDMER